VVCGSSMAEPLRVLLVGVPAGDEAALREALGPGRPLEVGQATDATLGEALALRPRFDCVLVDPAGTAHAAEAFGALLDAAGYAGCCAVVGEPRDEAKLAPWIEAGAVGWLFRPTLAGASLLVGLSRHHVRTLQSTAVLLELTRSPAFRGSDRGAAMRETTEAGVRGLPATVCAVWLFEDGGASLALADLFDARTGTHSTGRRLPLAEQHAYLAALRADHVVGAPDAVADPRTRDIADAWFKPMGLASTLDAAVRLRGETVGVICLQHAGAPRRWTPEDLVFARGLAALTSLALESAERHRAELALLGTEHRFREIFVFSNDSMLLYRVDPAGRVICEDMNPAGERTTGLSRRAIVGKQAHELIPADSAEKLQRRYQECIEARAPITYEHELRLPAGVRTFNTHLVPLLDAQGQVRAIASVARDVTAQREAEALQRRLVAQTLDTQKDEALARLAEHIAHDVNNLLTVIVAHAGRLQGLEGTHREAADAIVRATERGRELTQRVLSFGRRPPPQRAPLEVAPLVRETLKLLEPTARGVTMRSEVTPGLKVMGDQAQLNQVLTNLCGNAVEAMPGGGTLSVRVRAVDGDSVAAQSPRLRGKPWVCVSVSDTGVGMDEATRARIFEPFFSAGKERGTGLGLAVVHGIVTAHEGHLEVESAPGQGSTFHVYLPRQEEGEGLGHGQHLLLVDDHPGMARVAARLLESLGYRTSIFEDPTVALAAFQKAPGSFDAVLTDLSMPQLNGADFAREVHRLRPTLPVILSSGNAAQLSPEDLERMGVSAVLLKPWRIEEALSALQQALKPPG